MLEKETFSHNILFTLKKPFYPFFTFESFSIFFKFFLSFSSFFLSLSSSLSISLLEFYQEKEKERERERVISSLITYSRMLRKGKLIQHFFLSSSLSHSLSSIFKLQLTCSNKLNLTHFRFTLRLLSNFSSSFPRSLSLSLS